METTLVILKPDAVGRGLIGEIISRIERRGYIIRQMWMWTLSQYMVDQLYQKYWDEPWYLEQRRFMMGGQSVVMAVFGNDVILGMRRLAGPTNVKERFPGTVRGDFSNDHRRNLIHCSDSLESAQRELKIFLA